MRVLVECTEDPASVNIAQRLREQVSWEERGLFDGNRVLAHQDLRMITLDEMHLYSENLHERLPPSLSDPEVVVFLSRHASESGRPTLSVHPIGNFADAPYGGKPGRVVPSHPEWMAGLFHTLRSMNPDGYEVTYEATHHGPYLEVPTLYYELGSNEEAWNDEDAARVLAGALLEANPLEQAPVLWVGGGHYCPQVNDAVREGRIAPGHVIPGWATGSGIKEETLEHAVEAVPGCEGFVLQPEATSEEARVGKRLEQLGVPRVPFDP